MKPSDINKLVWTGEPALSPDATQVAYVVTSVDEKANRYRSRIWITATDGAGLPRPATAGEWDDNSPAWSPDGREIYYRDRNAEEMMAVSVDVDPTFRAGAPTRLFEDHYFAGGAGRSYDVAPDGRFLMIRVRDDNNADSRVVIVENWFEELERLVPTN